MSEQTSPEPSTNARPDEAKAVPGEAGDPSPAQDREVAENPWGEHEDAAGTGVAADADAAEAEDTGVAEAEGTAPTLPGPCKISWSNGAILRFQYAPEGGSVRVDHDRDGKADVCGTFAVTEQKTTRLQIDEACDGAFDLELVPEHDPNTNVAVAQAKGQALTFVTLPSFVGLDAGYTLHAARKDVKLTVRSGRVRKAEVRKPSEGPALAASFTYDGKGRITRIDEDFELDGTVDRRFDYRYDAAGKITRMQVTTGLGKTAQTGTARLDYVGCQGS